MTTLDAELGRPNHFTYLDDVALSVHDIATNWADMLTVLQHLIHANFLISAWKLQLLTRTLHIFGVVLCSSQYRIGRKSLKKPFGC